MQTVLGLAFEARPVSVKEHLVTLTADQLLSRLFHILAGRVVRFDDVVVDILNGNGRGNSVKESFEFVSTHF